LETNKGRKELCATKILLTDGKQIAEIRLGLDLVELDEKLASSLNYPFKGGLLLTKPVENSPQLNRGEILVRLNDISIRSFNNVSMAMQNVRYGDKVKALFINVVRQNNAIYLLKKEALIEAQ
jgi:S1-C subfamily serine protease